MDIPGELAREWQARYDEYLDAFDSESAFEVDHIRLTEVADAAGPLAVVYRQLHDLARNDEWPLVITDSLGLTARLLDQQEAEYREAMR